MSESEYESDELEQRIAEFDAMFDEALHPDTSDNPEHSGIPLYAEEQAQSEPESDMVLAMQELLLKHEDTNANRVEDPDLERVLRELRNLGHSNIADVFKCEDVMEYIGVDPETEQDVFKTIQRLTVRDITKMPREVSACIQSVKVTTTPRGDVVEVKMYDKQVSLDKLMKFHGAYARDNEQRSDTGNSVMDLLLGAIGSKGLPTIENNDA